MNIISSIKERLKHLDTVMTVAWVLAIISAFFVHPGREYIDYIDLRSLGILWGLMIIIQGLKKNSVFERIAGILLSKVQNDFQLSVVLVFICFFGSMFITNDVALITFVPFAMMILQSCKKEALMIPVVVFQTIAANLGSMLTPIGNPQNLYMYGLTGMSITEFIGIMLPYSVLSAVLLFICLIYTDRKVSASAHTSFVNDFTGSKSDMNDSGNSDNSYARGTKHETHTGYTFDNSDSNHDSEQNGSFKIASASGNKAHITVYLLLFIVALMTVLRVLPWYSFCTIVLAAVSVLDRKILAKADYILLLTFIGFFIFTGNMGRIGFVRNFFESIIDGKECLIAIAASQVISNVPATLMLSGFVSNYKELIIGVNVGGLGTLIASMASLISYKAYTKEYKENTGRYFTFFTIANVLFLIPEVLLWIIMR